MSFVNVNVLLTMHAYICDYICHKVFVIKYIYVHGCIIADVVIISVYMYIHIMYVDMVIISKTWTYE